MEMTITASHARHRHASRVRSPRQVGWEVGDQRLEFGVRLGPQRRVESPVELVHPQPSVGGRLLQDHGHRVALGVADPQVRC